MSNVAKIILGLCLMLTSVNMYGITPDVVEPISQTQFKDIVGDYTKGTKSFKSNNKSPIVVDFSAKWCGPCKRLSPILEELAREYQNEVQFYKIDIDANAAIARAFGVTSVPTVLFFPTNEKFQGIVGLYSKEDIKRVIEYVFYNRK